MCRPKGSHFQVFLSGIGYDSAYVACNGVYIPCICLGYDFSSAAADIAWQLEKCRADTDVAKENEIRRNIAGGNEQLHRITHCLGRASVPFG